MLALSEGKQKCDRIGGEDYEKKSCVSDTKINDVQNMYRTGYGLLAFAGNYCHVRKFAQTNFMCRCGEARKEDRHIMSTDCPVYADIRQQFSDLNDDKELVKYFTLVLARRDELDSQRKD